MSKIFQTIKGHYLSLFFWGIMIVAVVSRFYLLGKIPADIHQDEAHVGYDAFSLLTTGADSWGYANPIYLMGWGSGTSILYALLAKMAFFVFNVDVWALRLPQALMSVVSCYVFYRLLRLFYDKKTALVGLFLITVVPWQIMSARWALDANIAPAFWLLGFYFYCKGVRKTRYLFLSAIFYALTMYAYASFWLFMAATLPMQWLYLLWVKRTKQVFYGLVLSGVLFLILVSPLILLILVNQGEIPEIRTSYFSVPKMLFWRGQEIGFDNLSFKATLLFNIFVKQSEGWIANMLPDFGLFYLFSPFFMLLGMGIAGYQSYREFRAKKFSFSFCVLWQIVTGIFCGLMIFAFSNRINFLFIPLMVSLTLGVMLFFRIKVLFLFIIGAYMYLFVSFSQVYLVQFNRLLAGNYLYSFSYGFKEALKQAEMLHSKTSAEIHILEEPYAYAKVLFYSQVNPKSYQKSVTWYDYPNAFMQARKFLYYHFDWEPDFNQLPSSHIYIAHGNRMPFFVETQLTGYGNYVVVAPK